MPRVQKKLRKKSKTHHSVHVKATPRILWSMLVSVVGIVLIAFLLIWFVLPNVLPVERSLIAIVSRQNPQYVLLVGLDEDPKQRQAVLVELNETEQQLVAAQDLATINRSLQLVIDQLVVVDGDWPTTINSTLVADVIRGDINHRLPKINRELMQLLASWYLIQRGEEFSQIDDAQLAATELQRDWGSALTAGDDCQLAVLNSTEQSGLAGGVTQLIEKNGGVVIRLKQYPEQINQSIIYLDENQSACKPIVQQIQNLFEESPAVEPMSSVENTYRAPLVIILGNDYLAEIE